MPDLWLIIYARFDLKTLGRIAQVSHFFYYVSENDRIWRPLYEFKFGNSVNYSPKISRGNNNDAKRPKEMQMTVLSKSSGSDQLNNSNDSTHAPADQTTILGSIFHHSQHNVVKGPSWKERYRRELLQILKVTFDQIYFFGQKQYYKKYMSYCRPKNSINFFRKDLSARMPQSIFYSNKSWP